MSEKKSPSAPAKKPAKAKTPINADKVKAGKVGLPLPHYRILACMPPDKEVDYKFIEDRTGYYSNLTAVLRKGKANSLSDLGLVKELPELKFKILAKGLKLLDKLKAD